MIKNIILDFGDVFINLDKSATLREMARYGLNGLTPQLDRLFKAYEMGKCTTAQFLEQTNALFPKASRQNLVNAWNAMLLDFPDERLEFIENLSVQGDFRLFLLSNTNEMHIEHVKKSMGHEKFERFKNCFEVFYLSHEMGKRKPDSDIFEQVLTENGLRPKETLFVDDTPENTCAAAQLGMHVWNLEVGKEDIVELRNHLL